MKMNWTLAVLLKKVCSRHQRHKDNGKAKINLEKVSGKRT